MFTISITKHYTLRKMMLCQKKLDRVNKGTNRKAKIGYYSFHMKMKEKGGSGKQLHAYKSITKFHLLTHTNIFQIIAEKILLLGWQKSECVEEHIPKGFADVIKC